MRNRGLDSTVDMDQAPVIPVRHLTKRYADFVAVNDISFEVQPGEIFGIVGPNGAGKTSAIESVMGLRWPYADEVRVLGLDPHRHRTQLAERIGMQLQQAELPRRLKVRELLDLFASFYQHAVPYEPLLKTWGLWEKRHNVFEALSGGQKQRLFIALALLNDPELVFLDELTTGLDPQARRQTRDLVRDIRAQGKTVVLVTHFMEEAQTLCDHVAIVDGGQIVALDTPDGLLTHIDRERGVVFGHQPKLALTSLEALPAVERVALEHGTVKVFGSADALIDGDLVAAGNRCHLFENARVTGGVTAACATLDILGAVGRDLRGAAGEVMIDGHVRGNAQIRADRLVLGPQARIDGDLDYKSRTPLSPEEAARVGGTVLFDEVVDDDASSGGRTGVLLFWLWQTAAALLAGILMVAFFRGLVSHLGAVLADNTTVGALLGFAAFLVVPAGSVVAMVTIIGLPVGIAVVLLFVVALYAAKLPVAAWVGGRLLALAGRPAASPYAGMALGIVALYLLIAIPYLGRLVWLVATWLGLGAIVLSGRPYLQTRRSA